MVEVNVIEVCVTNVVILSGHMWACSYDKLYELAVIRKTLNPNDFIF